LSFQAALVGQEDGQLDESRLTMLQRRLRLQLVVTLVTEEIHRSEMLGLGMMGAEVAVVALGSRELETGHSYLSQEAVVVAGQLAGTTMGGHSSMSTQAVVAVAAHQAVLVVVLEGEDHLAPPLQETMPQEPDRVEMVAVVVSGAVVGMEPMEAHFFIRLSQRPKVD